MKIRALKFLVLSVVVGLSVATSNAGTQDGLFAGFGFTDNWSVFEVGMGNVQEVGMGNAQFNNRSLVMGDVGIANAKQVEINNGTIINGKLVLGSTSIQLHVQNGSKVTGGISYRNLSRDSAAANAASAYFAGLTPTNTSYGKQITLNNGMSLTINSTAPTNVFSLQNLTVNHGSVLTLSGNATSRFVFDITGNFNVNDNSAIKLTGGLTANDVVFELIGKGNGDIVNNNSKLAGSVVATQRSVSMNNGSNTIVGAVISQGLELNNQSKIVSAEF